MSQSQTEQALDVIIDLLGIAATIAQYVEHASLLIKQARTEGRELTDAELDTLRSARNTAREAALNA